MKQLIRCIYDPSNEDEYANWLGVDPDKDSDLFWIAREGLKAPLPESWKPLHFSLGKQNIHKVRRGGIL